MPDDGLQLKPKDIAYDIDIFSRRKLYFEFTAPIPGYQVTRSNKFLRSGS
jgi:hypothetical protein